jgi:hypothetical protein
MASQALLFPDFAPVAANDNDETTPRKRSEADELRQRIARLERELEMEKEAGMVLEMALADVVDPQEFAPQVYHVGPSVARCRGWHRGDCAHACGQQFLAARKFARQRLDEAKLIRRRYVGGGE